MRGGCGGPFAADLPGVEQDDDGRWLLRGDSVRFEPRWAKVWWGSCPFALIGHADCPKPGAGLESIGRVLDLVAWTKDGAPLRDMEPAPSDGLFDAVLLARGEMFRRWKADQEG